MPSEQRLHWATLFFDLARQVKQFALPAVLVIFGTSQSTGGPGGTFGRLPDRWEAWLLVLFVPAMLFAIIRYLTFRLRYDDRELVIRTGLIFRNERHIPFSRIQNVDASQNVFHRLFDVAEVRVETGGGKEEEAKLSVLPYSAFIDMRQHVFRERSRVAPASPDSPASPASLDSPASPASPDSPASPASLDSPASPATLLHLNLRELLLCGFLENKGMVLIGAAFGVGWESGLLNRVSGRFFDRSFFRDLFRPFVDDGPFPVERVAIGVFGFAVFLVLVRIISMIWAFVRLYDFRLTRVGEDLRTEYGLFTKVAATVPIRRVQSITINAGPLHRWLERATVRVATAGGTGKRDQSAANVREWLAPLIRQQALPHLLQQVLPGFDLSAVTWQPVHPRAFARAVKPTLVVSAIVTLGSALVLGWGAVGVFIAMLVWSILGTRKLVEHLGWAEDDEVVMMRSGWIWRQITLARVNKIQAVAMHQSPFDRRAAMARVRVDTAGASPMQRVDIPYLDREIARDLAQRLSASAANTTFRW
jgi:putative membrane protein